jgi:ankyrin repeat protein
VQFRVIFEYFLPVTVNLLMRRSIVPRIVETSRIRRRLIHQAQDRNHSSAYTNDYAFFAHGHLLGPLDVRVSEMFSDGSNGNHAASRNENLSKIDGL